MNAHEWFTHNWRWATLFIVLAFITYWTAIVVQPTIEILNKQNVILGKQNEFMAIEAEKTRQALQVAEWVLDNITALDVSENVTNIENQLEILHAQHDAIRAAQKGGAILLNMTNSSR